MNKLLELPPQLSEIADYLVEYYTDQSSSFPPKLWASSDLSSQHPTNACKLFYSQFKPLPAELPKTM